jgi:hypothetical protein
LPAAPVGVREGFSPVPATQVPSNRPIWLAIIILAAVIVAAAAAFVLLLAHAAPAAALTAAGVAFTATVSLCMAAARFLTD